MHADSLLCLTSDLSKDCFCLHASIQKRRKVCNIIHDDIHHSSFRLLQELLVSSPCEHNAAKLAASASSQYERLQQKCICTLQTVSHLQISSPGVPHVLQPLLTRLRTKRVRPHSAWRQSMASYGISWCKLQLGSWMWMKSCDMAVIAVLIALYE